MSETVYPVVTTSMLIAAQECKGSIQKFTTDFNGEAPLDVFLDWSLEHYLNTLDEITNFIYVPGLLTRFTDFGAKYGDLWLRKIQGTQTSFLTKHAIETPYIQPQMELQRLIEIKAEIVRHHLMATVRQQELDADLNRMKKQIHRLANTSKEAVEGEEFKAAALELARLTTVFHTQQRYTNALSIIGNYFEMTFFNRAQLGCQVNEMYRISAPATDREVNTEKCWELFVTWIKQAYAGQTELIWKEASFPIRLKRLDGIGERLNKLAAAVKEFAGEHPNKEDLVSSVLDYARKYMGGLGDSRRDHEDPDFVASPYNNYYDALRKAQDIAKAAGVKEVEDGQDGEEDESPF